MAPSIRINAIVSALKAAGVFYPGRGSQKLVLEKIFYQFCHFLLASITLVIILDGPGRPPVKRGTRVTYRPSWLIEQVKSMATNFGFYIYEASLHAPGEAEAELAVLNERGHIDGVISEDSDAFIFGAQVVIRTLGFVFRLERGTFSDYLLRPSVQHHCNIYALDSFENSEGVALDRDGLFLCALLLGGDYDPGISGIGAKIAHALALLGFGRRLCNILKSSADFERIQDLNVWRTDLRQELRTNSSGRLGRRYFALANAIPDSFPKPDVVHLYRHPLTSWSRENTGPMPDPALWTPRAPDVRNIVELCSLMLGWMGENLLKKMNSNLWPGVAFQMISSVNHGTINK
ncbi:PIN domain-like protein [Mycena crocata]|nr:PIN domain-like protein [Mycena crocata]